MKFSEKMWLMITLKVTKNEDLTLSLKDTFPSRFRANAFKSGIFSLKPTKRKVLPSGLAEHLKIWTPKEMFQGM